MPCSKSFQDKLSKLDNSKRKEYYQHHEPTPWLTPRPTQTPVPCPAPSLIITANDWDQKFTQLCGCKTRCKHNNLSFGSLKEINVNDYVKLLRNKLKEKINSEPSHIKQDYENLEKIHKIPGFETFTVN